MMKSKTMRLFGLAVTIGCIGASNVPDPEGCFPNACGKNGEFCKSPSLKIWKQYCESKPPKATSTSGVYSGTCFHEAANRDPLYPHHGVVLIDKINSKYHFGGEFAFFAEGNPYENLDIKEAKNKMPWFYAEDHEIKWDMDHARVLLNPAEGNYHQTNYFIKKGIDEDTLFMVGYWNGAAYRVFCELTRNE